MEREKVNMIAMAAELQEGIGDLNADVYAANLAELDWLVEHGIKPSQIELKGEKFYPLILLMDRYTFTGDLSRLPSDS